MQERIAVVPGSFDPITNGHLDIIKKAAALYDKVYVAVMINDKKKYMFTLEERRMIAESAIEGIDRVEVISSSGWLWELAKSLGACAIVKGYRNEADLRYEQEMAVFNEARYPEAKTVLLKAENGLEELSSTLIREKIRNNESLEGYLPIAAIRRIKEITP
jgi:pantetheine-phosphate adenylyltransferase